MAPANDFAQSALNFQVSDGDNFGGAPFSDLLRRASIEMQAFVEGVSPRAHLLEIEEDKPVDEPSIPLIENNRRPRRKGTGKKNRDMKRLMLDGIPSNWAELLAYVILMCLCHLILRLAIVRSGLPSDQNVFKPADQFNNYLLLAHCSSTAYLLGSVALTHVLRTSYILLMMISALTFTLICEFPVFQSSLSYDSMQHWSIHTIVGYSFAACALVFVLLYQWALTKRWSVSYGRLYLSSILLVLGFHAVLWALLPRGVHLHHWYCAWVYMFLLRSQDKLIISAHAIATGIFLQGIASYGCASVLFNPR